MSLIAVLACAVAVVVGLLRWVRVAQREHYIPGSCMAVARRWVRVRPPNELIAGLASGIMVGTFVARINGQLDIAAWAASGVAVCSVALPWPMTVLGTEVKLNFTRRARTLLILSVLLVVVLAGLGALLDLAVPFMAALALLVPAVVDLANMILAPLERRSLDTFRRDASRRLGQVQPVVIAVTGSWGKTSTKNHIRDLLSGSREVLATPASWNNTAGLSKAINEHLTDTCEVFVAEMGMYGPGEIRAMCEWVKPDIAVITAVGPMHLERAGSLERIVEAKAEILERASQAVLWTDTAELAKLADETDAAGEVKVWRVGTAGRAGLDVAVAANGDDVVISRDGAELGRFLAANGLHPGNVGCAVAAALAAGVDAAALGPRIATLSNPDHRAIVGRNDAGTVIIDDTFSSNPAGSRAALATLVAAVEAGGKMAVITPGMVEMGASQYEENRRFAEAVAAAGATLVVVGWTNRKALLAGAAERGEGGGEVIKVASRPEAREWVRSNLGEGDGALYESDLPDHYA